MKRQWILDLLLLAVFPGVQSFVAKGSAQDKSSPLKKLESEDKECREIAAKQLLRPNKELIESLLKIAHRMEEKPHYNGPKELAINLLGELRAVEAVPFLIKNLNYTVPYKAIEPNPIKGYPCGSALIAIGHPIYPEVWARLKNAVEPDLDVKILAYVIRAVDGYEIGLVRLELARREADNIATVDGRTIRKNLDNLIKHYKAKAILF